MSTSRRQRSGGSARTVATASCAVDPSPATMNPSCSSANRTSCRVGTWPYAMTTRGRSQARPGRLIRRASTKAPEIRDRLLTRHVVRLHVVCGHDTIRVRGDMRAYVLIEVVTQDEGSVFADANEVRRDVERLL